MKTSLRTCIALSALSLAHATFVAKPATAQDVVQLGSLSARAGDLASVPIRIRDRANTPLGGDASAELTIRGVALTVEYSPASAVESIDLVRAGLTATLTPRFQSAVQGASSYSWIASFDEAIPFTGGAQLVGELSVRLAADAPEGEIELHLVGATTGLSNGTGTVVETEENGLLQLVDGSVEVVASCTTVHTLCLLDDRFFVDVEWVDFNGNPGVGNAVQLTSDAGYFWFFNDDNVEAVVKVLDGRTINGNVWVFYGALSNVEYEITVTDSVTGAVKTYFNPAGRFASVGDTNAFLGLGRSAPPPLPEKSIPAAGTPATHTPAKQGTCAPDATSLCLLDGRFRLEMSWQDFSGGRGVGNAVKLTDDAGYFWFFNDDNVELVVKTLDGRSINGNFWVFYGALSNVEFTLSVTDIQTGAVKTYANPLGTFASVGDTAAF